MDMHELEAETAELLPGREALGKLSFSFTKNLTVHKAYVSADNTSNVGNFGSPGAVAEGEAVQSISITQ
ncbi:hypothetical protein KDK95_00265 [Actinospica sp. MGRD01-02]|uniref:Uncharacterized protein n=1 Tax=Actinospica acidithermotolerans TaxID=2828514 RepID=A0A941E8W8_9ACTN|nr:hypothetical protein [Actinospica acidithermotolerans]MBR7824724.1 hypothetical protein [Actinospica acidithermotolerans]